jgi:hypothetical protein
MLYRPVNYLFMLEFGLKIYSKLYYFELEKLKKRREIKLGKNII